VNVPIGPNISFAQQQAEQSPALTRRRFGLPLDAVVVIFFGFLHPEKGLERLIEAVSRLRPAIPAIRLVMAGGLESHSVAGEDAAKLRHDLQSVARANGLERDVIFTGYLPEQDVSQLLQTANAAVFPFNAGVTGKSGSLLAAQAHGVPTIATHRCDMSREAADVEGVLRIPPCDTAALTDALRKVLTDPRLASRLARAGRAHAAKHTWQAIVGRHAQIYAEIRSRGISSVRSRQPDRSMASAVAVQANVVTRMEDHVVAQAHNRTAAGSRG
jgi:glycosyltransferase involved in cell wall biosynthesis